MLKFQKMTNDEFEDYFDSTVNKYAQEKIKSGNWNKKTAIERAKSEVNKLLPDGVETENNYLYSIYNNNNNNKHL